jgi:hypothetical protein
VVYDDIAVVMSPWALDRGSMFEEPVMYSRRARPGCYSPRLIYYSSKWYTQLREEYGPELTFSE